MSQFYQNLDRVGGFDYQLVGLKGDGEAKFRGPAIDLDKPFIAYVGAAQTFGRFVERPFPTLLAERLGLPALNLGAGGAGPRHFDRPEYLDALNRAEAVVLQVLSGRSASCSLFDNSATGRIVGVTPLSQTRVRSEEFLKRAAAALSAKEFAAVIAEMRADYVASFQALLEKIRAPRILLWFSKRTPDYVEDYDNPPQGVLGEFPQLVNARMVSEIATHCDVYVECVSSAGIPQPLWPSDRAIEGAQLRGDTLVNRYYPSPEMHRAAADLLEGPCRRLTGRRARSTPAERFVVIGAERTGTNLLISLINQYTGCFCGNELFNSSQIEKGKLAWLDVDETTQARLLARRAQDPVGVLDDLREIARARGYGVVGFKLMYSHGLAHPALLDALTDDTELKVIHVRRRNALRRVVSERQARAASRWAVGRLDEAPIMPKVEITFDDMVLSLMRTQSREADFRTRFAGHDVLEVIYEDIAARPERVAARAAEFLGLPARDEPPVVKLRKMGAENIADALAGGAALRASLNRWVSFFDE